MEMGLRQKRDARDAILQALRKGPLTLTELSVRTRYQKSTIFYHMKRLRSENIVEKDEQGRYSIGGDERTQEVIINILIEERKTERRLLEDPRLAAFDEDTRRIAFETLKAKGDIESEPRFTSLSQMSEIMYRPSFRACARKGICYMCLQPVKADQGKVIPAVAGLVREEIWGDMYLETVVDMHPRCFSEWLIEVTGDVFQLARTSMCAFCGLPLSPLDLWDLIGYQTVDIRHLESLLTVEERERYLDWRKSPLGEGYGGFPFRSSMTIKSVENLFEQVETWTEKKGLKMDKSWGQERKREILNELRDLEQKATNEKSRAISALFSPFGTLFSNIEATYAIGGGYESSWTSAEGKEERHIYPAVPIGGDHALFLIDSEGRRFHPYCYSICKNQDIELRGGTPP